MCESERKRKREICQPSDSIDWLRLSLSFSPSLSIQWDLEQIKVGALFGVERRIFFFLWDDYDDDAI